MAIQQISASKLEAMIWCTRFVYWSGVANESQANKDLTSYVLARMGMVNAVNGLNKTGIKPSEMLIYVDDLDKQLRERKADKAKLFDQEID